MRRRTATTARAGAVCLGLLGWIGCTEQPTAPEVGATTPYQSNVEPRTDAATPNANGGSTSTSPAPEPAPPAAPPRVEMPPVEMTQAELATCLVKVGDVLPDVTLPAVSDSEEAAAERSLAELTADRPTIVFFWSADNPRAVAALVDLAVNLEEIWRERGVNVVGVNVQDTPEAVQAAVTEAGAEFPQLLDGDGAYFAQIAVGRPPRVYLVDGQRKILWFDLEYSTSTRRELAQAVEAATPAESD